MQIRPLQAAEIEAARQLLMANGWAQRVADAGEFRAMDGISNGYISMLVVAASHRRHGIGRALAQSAIGDDRRMTWMLRAGRPGVAGFYEKLGFKQSKVAMERAGARG